ncbi:hypothetical protein EVAR_71259_1 [Eumeta japonica]|uniref:Uncharacterized protein n=1 Tax=Eumeta variegata TaxID=151549 RepID=A0A4C1SSN0_EUMVA|nr:hypothetical protein EVAR_71259_1 [Eumeta japonica]
MLCTRSRRSCMKLNIGECQRQRSKRDMQRSYHAEIYKSLSIRLGNRRQFMSYIIVYLRNNMFSIVPEHSHLHFDLTQGSGLLILWTGYTTCPLFGLLSDLRRAVATSALDRRYETSRRKKQLQTFL